MSNVQPSLPAGGGRELSEFRFDLTFKRHPKELRLDRKSALPVLKKSK